ISARAASDANQTTSTPDTTVHLLLLLPPCPHSAVWNPLFWISMLAPFACFVRLWSWHQGGIRGGMELKTVVPPKSDPNMRDTDTAVAVDQSDGDLGKYFSFHTTIPLKE